MVGLCFTASPAEWGRGTLTWSRTGHLSGLNLPHKPALGISETTQGMPGAGHPAGRQSDSLRLGRMLTENAECAVVGGEPVVRAQGVAAGEPFITSNR